MTSYLLENIKQHEFQVILSHKMSFDGSALRLVMNEVVSGGFFDYKVFEADLAKKSF